MPYIAQDRRKLLTSNTQPVALSAGELNFQITELIRNYLECEGLRYKTMNDILGALEGAKMEFYRRVAIPYEEEKIKLNGDVY